MSSASPSAWPSRDDDRKLFPLTTVGGVRRLFESHLARPEPNLALLSIVAGFVENTLTSVDSAAAPPEPSSPTSSADATNVNLAIHPALDFGAADTLMAKFESTVRGFCDPSLLLPASSERDDEGDRKRKLIKHVADIIWNTLSKSAYKDRPHLQSVYSYMTGSKLDCFGVAFAVVAACQLLQASDVHLALSEDHAWVIFGGGDGRRRETAEVTWHGKGSEDKRGQPVDVEKAKTSWLYVAGMPVVCDRFVEVAALVSAINPAISSSTDSVEVGAMQQELLWLLYDSKHLKAFPMAIGNLGDLEEISPSLGRSPCLELYEEAIEVSRTTYSNHHVYPYTYKGGYHFRRKEYQSALECWANAATVMQLYNYSKDDEEIYKEFMEVANDLIPHILKQQSEESSSSSLLRDPDAYKNLLRFYDGICCWEEGSQTAIMHIGWAKPVVGSVSKFLPEVRSAVAREGEEKKSSGQRPDQAEGEEEGGGNSSPPRLYSNSPNSSANSPASPSLTLFSSPSSSSCLDDGGERFQRLLDLDGRAAAASTTAAAAAAAAAPPPPPLPPPEQRQGQSDNASSGREDGNNGSAAVVGKLSTFCGDRLLNAAYLLGASKEPFERNRSPLEFYSRRMHLPEHPLEEVGTTSADVNVRSSSSLFVDVDSGGSHHLQQQQLYADFVLSGKKGPSSSMSLVLRSAKMRGLQGLFGAAKPNASAIQLQLTAQSQTLDAKKFATRGEDAYLSSSSAPRSKRSRRDC